MPLIEVQFVVCDVGHVSMTKRKPLQAVDRTCPKYYTSVFQPL